MHKKVFISASSSGIGYMLAKNYLALGYRVIINGKNLFKLKKAAASLNNCDYYCGNLSDEKNIKSAVKYLKIKHNFIDLLICNLGNSDFKKNHSDLDHALKHNFFSTVKFVKNANKILKKQVTKIICISSICGVERIDGAPIGYSIAKSALNFYIKLISTELAKDGITINGILPGNIIFKGSTWDKKIKKNKIKIKKYIKSNVPINNFGNPDDIFEVCKMISESETKFITGSLFKLDGGQTKSN